MPQLTEQEMKNNYDVDRANYLVYKMSELMLSMGVSLRMRELSPELDNIVSAINDWKDVDTSIFDTTTPLGDNPL